MLSDRSHAEPIIWWRASDVLRSRHAIRPMALWLAITAFNVAAGLISANWFAIPFRADGATVSVTVYPPVGVSALLTLLLGPAWGASSVFIASFLVSLHAGTDLLSGFALALAAPVMLLTLWSSMTMLGVSPALAARRDWFRFAGLALLATSASSVGALVWSFAREMPLSATELVWEGWLLGDFLQILFVAGPILHFGYGRTRQWLLDSCRVAPARVLSARTYIALIGIVFATLALDGLQAGRLFVWSVARDGVANTRLSATLTSLLLVVGAYITVLLALAALFSLILGTLIERQKQAASLDPLTRCLNRRAFVSIFSDYRDRLAADRDGMALIVLDLDHFKDVNDSYGHSAGDNALLEFAERVKRLIRRSDYLFRWGGEEFAVLLPKTGLDRACDIAERIRVSLASEPIAIPSGAVRVTVSAGVAHGSGLRVSEERLFGEADAACYRAKQNGRNRVEVMAA